MYSIGILSTVLFALFATTNALECRPVTCMLACPFGFDINAQGCPICTCRKTQDTCYEPIFGYNCGSMDHRDCPSSHECQLGFTGLTGQCCLKRPSSTTASLKSTTASPKSTTASPKSTTARTVTSASTAWPTTTIVGKSTRRSLNRLLTFSAGSTTQGHGTGSPATTTQRAVTTSRWTRPATSTQSTVTTGRWTRPPTSTQHW